MRINGYTVKFLLLLGFSGLLLWAVITQIQLNQTKQELTMVRTDLANTITALNNTNNLLQKTQSDLLATIDELNLKNNEIAETKRNLALASIQLMETEKLLAETRSSLAETEQILADTRSELEKNTIALIQARAETEKWQIQYQQSQKQLQIATDTLKGLGITIYTSTECRDVSLIDNPQARNPTWQEAIQFLADDKTENHAYIENVYDCSQFSRDLHNNAETVGIRTAEVQIWFEGMTVGHALNAFLTDDHGLVFIDSMYEDKIARVKTGQKYRAVSLTEYPYAINFLNDDLWWNSLSKYYFIPGKYGLGEASVAEIYIYW